ncbi:hypothetical protein FKP32DRAFT_1593238 [Trametes sanguinea]|nr:hypothetical protein FKP32DRAFT_1593238 [Trametes sanguinea]
MSSSNRPLLGQSTIVDSSALTATISPPFIGDPATISNVSAATQAAIEPLVNSLYDHTYWAITQAPGWVVTHDFVGDYVEVIGFTIPWSMGGFRPPTAEYSVDGQSVEDFTAPESLTSPMLNVTYYRLSSNVLLPGQHTLRINITHATQDDPWLIDYIIFGSTGVSTTTPSTASADTSSGSISSPASTTALSSSNQTSTSSATSPSASIAPASAGQSNQSSSFPLAPVIGGVAGGIVVIAALLALLYYFWRRSRDSGAFIAEEYPDDPDVPKQPSIRSQHPPRNDDAINFLPRGKGPLYSTTTSQPTAPVTQPAPLGHTYPLVQGSLLQHQLADRSQSTPMGWAEQHSAPPVANGPLPAAYPTTGARIPRNDLQPSWNQSGPSTPRHTVADYAGPSMVSTDSRHVSPPTPPRSHIPYTTPAVRAAPITAAFMIPPSSMTGKSVGPSPYPSLDGLRSTARDTLRETSTTPPLAMKTANSRVPSPTPLTVSSARSASPRTTNPVQDSSEQQEIVHISNTA